MKLDDINNSREMASERHLVSRREIRSWLQWRLLLKMNLMIIQISYNEFSSVCCY